MRSIDVAALLLMLLPVPSLAGQHLARTAVEDDALRSLMEGSYWVLQLPADAANEQSRAPGSVDLSVALTFSDRHLGFDGACGRYSAPYRVQGEWLETGEMMRGGLPCAEDKELLRRLAGMTGGRMLLRQDEESNGSTLMHFVTASGSRLTAQASGRAESGDATTVYVEISEQPSLCRQPRLPGLIPCPQMRELAYSANGVLQPITPWYPLLHAIKGFQPTAGIRSVLRLRRYPVAEPDLHGPVAVQELDMVLESERRPFQQVDSVPLDGVSPY